MKRQIAIILLSLVTAVTGLASVDGEKESYIYWQVTQDSGSDPLAFEYAMIKAVDADGNQFYLTANPTDYASGAYEKVEANGVEADGFGYDTEAVYAYLNGYKGDGFSYAIELYSWNDAKNAYEVSGSTSLVQYSDLASYITEANSTEIPAISGSGDFAAFGNYSSSGIGFHVVPEPSCALLLVGGCIVLMSRHRKIA